MKIGIVMPLAGQRGGAELMLLHLLRANRHTTMIDYSVAFLEDGPLVRQVSDMGYSVKVIQSGKLRQLHKYTSAVFSIWQWLRKEKVDLVMSWMTKAHLYAGPAAVIAGLDAVWWQHGLPVVGWIDRCAGAIPAKAILCCSEAALMHQSKLTPQVAGKVIHPAVDLNVFNQSVMPAKEEIREELGLPQGIPIVGMVARLQRWKGVHIFVEAASRVARKHPDVHFVVVGGDHFSEPDYPHLLKAQADKEGLAGRIHFTGQQANVQSWILSFDILVHASVGTEPFGMVIIEGMALGKAVIASKAGGPLEIITDGENGLLVPPNHPDSLAAAMMKLIEDREYYQALSGAAVERAGLFGTERLAREVADYLSVCIRNPQYETKSMKKAT
ncbi:glycosyltransferase family 4 protein [Paenibacillus hamazuiensis]|uniref:glycosyltransferase family 4 protein n=1 Tax=Paenibacillus hamazuiensis TaxID=2936508 RepID=UPI00200EB6B9|nr:glycosyltransferase family 4 protein [Paenibacillus hamazuiensis]